MKPTVKIADWSCPRCDRATEIMTDPYFQTWGREDMCEQCGLDWNGSAATLKLNDQVVIQFDLEGNKTLIIHSEKEEDDLEMVEPEMKEPQQLSLNMEGAENPPDILGFRIGVNRLLNNTRLSAMNYIFPSLTNGLMWHPFGSYFMPNKTLLTDDQIKEMVEKYEATLPKPRQVRPPSPPIELPGLLWKITEEKVRIYTLFS